ncbi:DUF3006 domain-containing protein [Myxococcus sp. K15C18031901]|uniref:DUF3006 domain-containing protein n=1 Tax=Myxococcus dinghuensis TaxID=2906761 RepID=UPI0020A78091|nr:DUF3006 domain-containing protein [Myxococcus dinghuensis]MCP3103236.1 DUF3006 domain-containing protein [Myxococcus dinghuensis]
MKTRTPGVRATVDRIEDDLAVLVVDGREVTRPLASLPEGVREGDVLDWEAQEVDREATEALRAEVEEARQRALRGKTPPPGDFDL